MVLLDIYMSFGPRIPNHDRIPAMRPGHNEQAQGVVIIDVHTVIFYSRRDASTGLSPPHELISRRRISIDDSKKWLIASVIRYGHASVWSDHCSLAQ